MASFLSAGSGGIWTSQWCDALLWVPHALLGEYWHPALPNLSQWPKDTRANQTWIMQPTNTWWPQNWVGCLLFKAMTSALDLPPLSPSTIGGLGPKRSEIQLRELPKTVFCFEDLWRTLEEWCSTAKHCSLVRKCLDGRTSYIPGRRWGWFIRDISADSSHIQLAMNLDLELKIAQTSLSESCFIWAGLCISSISQTLAECSFI